MSKYQVGDKFIIEIEKDANSILYQIKGLSTLRIKGFTPFLLDDNDLDRLERYDADAKDQQAEIKVGDEVMGVGDSKGIVTYIRKDKMYILWEDGSSGSFDIPTDQFKKTGRHFDIYSILEQLKGADNEA